jgi:hypothetical protein
MEGNITDDPEVDDNTTEEPGMEGNVTDASSETEGNVTDTPAIGTDSNSTTPPPVPGEFAPNTEEGVYFRFSYGFGNFTAIREPTQEEVEDLVCVTILWIRDTVRNATQDDTVQSVAMYLDWNITENSLQPINVLFMADTTYNDAAPVTAREVGVFTAANTPQIVEYLKNYVYNVQVEDSIFLETTSASFDSEVYVPIPFGKVEKANCPATAEAPTISPAPTVSFVPSPPPNSAAATQGNGTDGNGTDGVGADGVGTDGNRTAPPVEAPTTATGGAGGGSTSAPVPAGATRQFVHVQFIVSNLEDIVEIAAVNSSGLNAAWVPFVAEVVQETAAAADQRRGLREESRRRRQLRVEYEQGSAQIYDIILKSDCGEDVHDQLTCHDAFGEFSILLYEEDRDFPKRQEDKYGKAVVKAINEGKLQETLDGVDPSSPLYIGTVGKPGGGGMPLWLLILIILLCILFCCCLVGALFYLFVVNKDRGGEQKLESYDEEGFAYDFLIPPHQKVQTEVDDEVDDATKDADGEDEEFFEDEAGGEIAAQAVNSNDDDAAPATKMEESDDEQEGGEVVSDEEGVNVTAEVEDEDESDNEGDEKEPLVDGDDADSDAGEPEMVEIDNDMEGSESFHEPAAEAVEEHWDDDGEGDDDHSAEEWDDDDDDEGKEKK